MGQAETDCQAVVRRLYEFLDGELAETDRAAIERHLDVCSECVDHVGVEKHFKELIRLKCIDSAPPELIERVRALLRDR